MIFELLVGIAPFHGDDPSDMFRRITCGAVP